MGWSCWGIWCGLIWCRLYPFQRWLPGKLFSGGLPGSVWLGSPQNPGSPQWKFWRPPCTPAYNRWTDGKVFKCEHVCSYFLQKKIKMIGIAGSSLPLQNWWEQMWELHTITFCLNENQCLFILLSLIKVVQDIIHSSIHFSLNTFSCGYFGL